MRGERPRLLCPPRLLLVGFLEFLGIRLVVVQIWAGHASTSLLRSPMQPTAVRCLQPRRPMLSFRANKDYYKGNRQSSLPGHRTGAPGVHVNKAGRPGYKLLDSRVRVFVAPPIQDIINSPLKPYVEARTPPRHRLGLFKDMPDGGVDGKFLLEASRKYHAEQRQERERERSEAQSETGIALAT
ncbi:hypothetical protein MKEN_01098100 [Mycena kentingensis (nom. inval.)]|nr:hypothetical protein MKEN_01098100 [Mycena kentingensis (nom. inval.)]